MSREVDIKRAKFMCKPFHSTGKYNAVYEHLNFFYLSAVD